MTAQLVRVVQPRQNIFFGIRQWMLGNMNPIPAAQPRVTARHSLPMDVPPSYAEALAHAVVEMPPSYYALFQKELDYLNELNAQLINLEYKKNQLQAMRDNLTEKYLDEMIFSFQCSNKKIQDENEIARIKLMRCGVKISWLNQLETVKPSASISVLAQEIQQTENKLALLNRECDGLVNEILSCRADEKIKTSIHCINAHQLLMQFNRQYERRLVHEHQNEVRSSSNTSQLDVG